MIIKTEDQITLDQSVYPQNLLDKFSMTLDLLNTFA